MLGMLHIFETNLAKVWIFFHNNLIVHSFFLAAVKYLKIQKRF